MPSILHLDLKPSYYFLFVFLLIVSLANLAVWFALPISIALSISVAVFVYTLWLSCLLILRIHPKSVAHLTVQPDGQYIVTLNNGECFLAERKDECFVSVPLIILTLRVSVMRKKFSIILFPDACDANSLRRLRVLLKFQKH